MGFRSWTALRGSAFSATTPETEATARAATFVSLPAQARQIEVRGRFGNETTPLTTGATNPTGFTIAIWRKHEGKVDKIGTMFFTVSSNVALARETAVFDFDGGLAYATIESFVAGSTPALTGIIEARIVE